MTNRINVVYIENETDMLWSIELGAVCDENQTGQRYDQSYRFGLYQKQYWIFGILSIVFNEENQTWHDIIDQMGVIYAKK